MLIINLHTCNLVTSSLNPWLVASKSVGRQSAFFSFLAVSPLAPVWSMASASCTLRAEHTTLPLISSDNAWDGQKLNTCAIHKILFAPWGIWARISSWREKRRPDFWRWLPLWTFNAVITRKYRLHSQIRDLSAGCDRVRGTKPKEGSVRTGLKMPR